MAKRLVEPRQEPLADARVHAGAWFVENQQQRLRHASTGDEHLLTFALREDAERLRRRATRN